MSRLARTLVTAIALATVVAAQDDLARKEAELSKSAAGILANFARSAASQKVATRAKQAYDLIVDHYEPDNAAARTALGWRKQKGQWEQLPPDKRPKWEDKANNEQRYKVVDEWTKTARKLGDLHRVLGLELVKGENLARGSYHLERAVAYWPLDKEAHLALGHVEADGFFGTEEQVAFVKRMRLIETTALQLAKKEFTAEALALDGMPEELKRLGLEFHGAKSENFTIWTRGTQENADNCVKWSERALEFMTWLCGEEQAKRRAFKPRMKTIAWWGFVWTTKEREDFLLKNKEIWAGKSLDEAKTFANISWKSAQGPAMVLMKLTPAQMHDTMIAWVFHLGVGAGANAALLEGLHHAATWYLMATSITTFGALPEGTQGRKELALPESTNWWLRKMRDDATAGADWPLNQVPRERLSSFRNDVRVKSWSFMTWVLARHPDQWLEFFTKVPADKIPFPEEIDKVGETAFGRQLAEVEADWREWARGDSGVASATGYGPPLLPEKPNKIELAALERMNQVRATKSAWVLTPQPVVEGLPPPKLSRTEGSLQPLPPTDLDAEASMACEDHARYLTRWPKEHLKWPEAHEENPALDGFSPRGMRAGMRSVIVWTESDRDAEWARDTVDGWIGTVYHRFPLLMHNIFRFGYSFVNENGYSIGVLDMGSLEEPYDPATAPMVVAWPPPDMKNVPLQFHGIEHPNPLGDQPENEQDITRTGYPVSLQLQREYARTLIASAISLYEVKGRGKVPAKHCMPEGDLHAWRDRRGEPVPMWNHTPAEPLLKRMEEKEVVFGIPKAHLQKNTTYQVEVRLVADGNDPLYFVWEFTTGTQDEGLKF
jgi:hypothetical protein